MRHKDQWYQAEHPPLISRELWDSVRAILATNGRVRANGIERLVLELRPEPVEQQVEALA